MADTDYATKAELKQRISIEAASTASDTLLQQLLNAAAYIVDQVSRNPVGCERLPVGEIAFTNTLTDTSRYFDDDMSGTVHIDDLLTVTYVKRAGYAIDAAYYKLWPYNRGNGPATRILLLPGALLGTAGLTFDLTRAYGFPDKGIGAGQIEVSGTWGYCTTANRPSVVKEATLTQAERLYERLGLNPSELLAGYRDPYKNVDPLVMAMLAPVAYDIPQAHYPPING